MSNLTITDRNFNDAINSEKPVLVDFWADWCGPCKAVSPIIDELAKEFNGDVNIYKADMDDCPETVDQLNIQNVPFFAMFKDGAIINQQVGLVPKDTLVTMIKETI